MLLRTREFAASNHATNPHVQVGVQRILLLHGGYCANRMLRTLDRYYERRNEHSHLNARTYTYTIPDGSFACIRVLRVILGCGCDAH